MSTEILEQSPLYQEWTRKAKEEGRQEGRQEGVEDGMRQSVLGVLRGRFGELSPDLAAALLAAHQSTLEALLPDLAAISLEELRSRLGLS